MNKLKEWIDSASSNDRQVLVERAEITDQYLYLIANGQRSPSAAVAGRIEQAIEDIDRGRRERKEVTRADLCEACALCPYAIKCLKKEK